MIPRTFKHSLRLGCFCFYFIVFTNILLKHYSSHGSRRTHRSSPIFNGFFLDLFLTCFHQNLSNLLSYAAAKQQTGRKTDTLLVEEIDICFNHKQQVCVAVEGDMMSSYVFLGMLVGVAQINLWLSCGIKKSSQ